MNENGHDDKKKIEILERKLAHFEKDATKRGFYALNRIVNLQADRLNKFNLETEIAKDAKEDKVYDRTATIWEKLPKLLSELNSLKIELRISGDEESDTSKTFTDTIADNRR